MKKLIYNYIVIMTMVFFNSCVNETKKSKRQLLQDSINVYNEIQIHIKDSIWKASSSYPKDYKKIKSLEKKYTHLVNQCYDDKKFGTFNMNKYQDLMSKHNFKKIPNKYADYESKKEGFIIKITKGKSIPTHNGFNQNFKVKVSKILD